MFELIIYSGRQTTVKLITVLTLSDGYITIYEYSLVMFIHQQNLWIFLKC